MTLQGPLTVNTALRPYLPIASKLQCTVSCANRVSLYHCHFLHIHSLDSLREDGLSQTFVHVISSLCTTEHALSTDVDIHVRTSLLGRLYDCFTHAVGARLDNLRCSAYQRVRLVEPLISRLGTANDALLNITEKISEGLRWTE